MKERYEITGKIGQGGVGAVYRAYDHQLSRVVALKRLLPPDESELDEAPDQLLAKEATLMSSITHPNIISVYDAGVDEDGGFVVMEYVDGETLDETVSRSAFTEGDFINLAEQCLDGLTAAQAVGMLHRDIKPSNLMIRWLATGRFQVKIVDFGLAKLTVKPTIQTIDHGDAILGSIYFLAPEQFERRPLDKRTDLYALGCVFYYSLTQQYPFQGNNAASIMMAHLDHKIIPLQKFRPDLSESVVNWVNRLISRDMDERPADASDAMVELAQVIQEAGPLHKQSLSPSAPTSQAQEAEAVTVAEVDIPTLEEDIPTLEEDIRLSRKTSRLSRKTSRLSRKTSRLSRKTSRLSRKTSRLSRKTSRLSRKTSRLLRKTSRLLRRPCLSSSLPFSSKMLTRLRNRRRSLSPPKPTHR